MVPEYGGIRYKHLVYFRHVGGHVSCERWCVVGVTGLAFVRAVLVYKGQQNL